MSRLAVLIFGNLLMVVTSQQMEYNDPVMGSNTPIYFASSTENGKTIQFKKEKMPVIKDLDIYNQHNLDKKILEEEYGQKYFDENSRIIVNTECKSFEKNYNNKSDDEFLDHIYPKLLVVVDYRMYKYYNKNIESLMKYMSVFWHSVDLRFKELCAPKISLNIGGFVIPENAETLEFIESNSIGENSLFAGDVLGQAAEYFFKKVHDIPRTDYDIVVVMSHRKLSIKGGTYIAGLSYLSSYCTDNSALILHDDGGFGGINTATHEIGHVFGAEHDGKAGVSDSEEPLPDTEGYIMSYNKSTHLYYHFSTRSLRAMSTFFDQSDKLCMSQKPKNVGKALPTVYPGQIMSRNEQCTRRFGEGSYAYKDEESQCLAITCEKVEKDENSFSGKQDITYNLAEGTSCGDGKMCLKGLCVDDERAVFEPNMERMLNGRLPGEIWDRDHQCLVKLDSSADQEKNQNCDKLYCEDGKTHPSPPLDGTPCGDKKICYGGKCVKHLSHLLKKEESSILYRTLLIRK